MAIARCWKLSLEIGGDTTTIAQTIQQGAVAQQARRNDVAAELGVDRDQRPDLGEAERRLSQYGPALPNASGVFERRDPWAGTEPARNEQH